MRSISFLLIVSVFTMVISCATGPQRVQARSTASEAGPECETARLTILQLNDVYEISGTLQGKFGGLDRVATLRQKLKRQNGNTLTVLAGDFLAPTALNTAAVDPGALAKIVGPKFVRPVNAKDKIKLSGRPMTHALNAVPIDLVTYGNHEFDLNAEEIEANIHESDYRWVTGNVSRSDGTQWPKSEGTAVYEFAQEDRPGCVARAGIIAATVLTPKKHVMMSDPIASLRKDARTLRPEVNALIALTHLAIRDDQKVAEEIPELDLIIGGHDHGNMLVRAGVNKTPIAKADSNAKSVYIHDLEWDFRTKKLKLESRLVAIDEKIARDPGAKKVIENWHALAFDAFRSEGFEPEAELGILKEDLEGREEFVRGGPTKIVTEVSKAFFKSSKDLDAAIVDSGLVRLDDIIPAGPLTQYDVIRIMPAPNIVAIGNVPGQVLKDIFEKTIDISEKRYVDVFPVTEHERRITIGGKLLETGRTYRVAMTHTLLKRLIGLGVTEVSVGRDARQVFKEYLAKSLK